MWEKEYFLKFAMVKLKMPNVGEGICSKLRMVELYMPNVGEGIKWRRIKFHVA